MSLQISPDKRPDVSSNRAKLSLREREFIGACCTNGFKPTEACRQLGMGGKNPEKLSSRMMKRPHVQAEFEARRKSLETRTEITIERIAQRYAELAFAQHDGPLTASNVIAALDALGKFKGMFKPDQAVVIPVQFTFVGGPPITVDDSIGQAYQPVARAIDGTAHDTNAVALQAILGPDKPIPKGS